MINEILRDEALDRTPNREGGGRTPPEGTSANPATNKGAGEGSKAPFYPSRWMTPFGFGLPSGDPPRPPPGGGDDRRPPDRIQRYR